MRMVQLPFIGVLSCKDIVRRITVQHVPCHRHRFYTIVSEQRQFLTIKQHLMNAITIRSKVIDTFDHPTILTTSSIGRRFTTITTTTSTVDAATEETNKETPATDKEETIQIIINIESQCPYGVFNVPITACKEHVKHIFLQAALIYHPDRPNTGNTKIFICIRNAFEQIYYNTNNIDNNNDQNTCTRWKDDNEYNIWLQNEIKLNSQYLHFTINEIQQQELYTVHTTLQQGGLDKGGYWEMARYIAQNQHSDTNANNTHSSVQQQQTRLLSSSNATATATTSSSDTSVIHRRRRRPQR